MSGLLRLPGAAMEGVGVRTWEPPNPYALMASYTWTSNISTPPGQKLGRHCGFGICKGAWRIGYGKTLVEAALRSAAEMTTTVV